VLQVAIVLGSKSDEPYFEKCTKLLTELGIDWELEIISAHRNPTKTRDYAVNVIRRGIQVVIAGAGGAAALPGVIASMTTVPVVGVPLPTSELKGVDSLYAIVQMPPGIPVACMAVGEWGATNAAHLALQILALGNSELSAELQRRRDV
jgi:5-(carboxyamino)imidazole ribonucleotide mutase